MTVTFGGPMFQGKETEYAKSVHRKDGAHYNTYATKQGYGMDLLKNVFPEGEANNMNFVLFSTSGIHGSYTTIEEIEAGLKKYGEDAVFDEERGWPDDYHGKELTFLLVQPRIVCLTYGVMDITLEDIPWLKHLRGSSMKAVSGIGTPEASG